MKAVILIIMSVFALSTFANDKIAYINHKIAKKGAYLLCEDEVVGSFNSGKSSLENLEETLDMVISQSEVKLKLSDLKQIGSKTCIIINSK